MAQVRRKNARTLSVLTAAGIGLLTAIGLTGMSAQPAWLPVTIGIVVGGIALASSELAVLFAIIALSLPLIAAQPVLGFAMLIVIVACVRYLGADGARGFMIVGLSLAGAFLGPVWAGVALAGYLFGAGEGALAAGLACILVEVTGIALGRPMIGATMTGGSAHAILTFAHMPDSLLTGTWVAKSLTSLDTKAVASTIGGFSKISHPIVLILQPCFWALGAVAAATIAEGSRGREGLPRSVAAVSAGATIPALAGAALATALGVRVPWGWVATSLFASLIVAIVFVIVLELAFPPLKAVAKVPLRKASMATEDADVDELLRLIATAEDKLATNHTSVRVVMITDMKSFSRMTEEDGSVATAKAIQRHRDLLLPVIQRHGGFGKSTGGDGLVSAFESAADALVAATEMQRALAAHNAVHPDERGIWVRIGLASGEVVLDKGGRPFIGAGLNLAARVMNLADGGQVFCTADVAEAATEAQVRTFSFGEFELKNIARPVEIVEVMWAGPSQQPSDPRDTGAALSGPSAE